MRLPVVLLFCLIGSNPSLAQFSTVRGTVLGPTGDPVADAAVLLDDQAGVRVGTATDTGGAFLFPNVHPGSYVVSVSHVQYAPASDTIAVGFDQVHVLNLALREQPGRLNNVTVEAERTPGGSASTGSYHVSAATLARIPVPGLSPDLMGYLLTVPGASRLGDTGGQLFVRGGTPTQNLVLVDGMPLYQPFHIVGFYSAFPADILSYADVYAGGFGARYGGRISSVIDVATRNGNKRQVAGSISLAPFLSTARLEIPVVRDRVSLLVSGRESVIERVGPLVAATDFPFRFGDYFGKFHAFLSQTSSFSATGIRTYDRGEFRTPAGDIRRISWRNSAYGGRYQYLPAEYPVMTQLAVYISRYESDFVSRSEERVSETTAINGDLSFTYLFGSSHLDFGMFGRSYGFDYDLSAGRLPDGSAARGGMGSENVTEGGGYLDFTWELTRAFRTRTGIRLHAFSSGTGTSVEPRIQLTWRPGARDELGLAAGVYRQQILGLTSLQDLTDMFVAWTPSPAQRPVPSAHHLIASWRRTLGGGTHLRVEGYRKWLSHLASPRFDRVSEQVFRLDKLDGIAQGLEFQVEHAGPSTYLIAGYALASVRYEGIVPLRVGGLATPQTARSFNPSHDRRHQINVAAERQIGDWRLRALWQFGSGQPFSQVYGFYSALDVEQADPSYHTAPGVEVAALAAPFGGRTPAYHRLDLSVERHYMLGPAQLALQAGVVNAYDRENLFDYDLLSGERVDQLPLIPYAGVRASF